MSYSVYIHFIQVASGARVKWLHDATDRADRVRSVAYPLHATIHCLTVTLHLYIPSIRSLATKVMPHFAESSSLRIHNDGVSAPSITPRESSQARADRIRIKNRRRRYLELHPEYFHGTNLEHAGR